MSLNGKIVVVTGASKGLGLGVVRRLAEEGASIVAHYNSGDISAAEEIAREAGVPFTAFRADLSNMEEVRHLAEQVVSCGDIYGLVNNAGVCLFENFFEITEESYDFTFDVNMKSMFFLTQAVARQMVDRGTRGRIINFSSIQAFGGSATQVHYGAAKGAVWSFTRMLAEALGPYGITVNAIAPGAVPTKHNSAFLAQEATRESVVAHMTMGGYGKPEYIADGVAYLLGDRAEWTSGIVLPVDGGYLCK